MDKRSTMGWRKTKSKRGSALMITVVLISLLAIVAVLFALTSRMDRIGSIGMGYHKELDMAVDTVVTLLSGQLIRDVPGMPAGDPREGLPEYEDYPDANNAFLSSLEPTQLAEDSYTWRQISRLPLAEIQRSTEVNGTNADEKTDEIFATYVADRVRIDVNEATGIPYAGGVAISNADADADGDGIGDAKWYKLRHFTANDGKPMYVALRVIDHGAMLNANTAYAFSPPESGATVSPELRRLLRGENPMAIDLVSVLTDRAVDPNSTGADYDLEYQKHRRALDESRIDGTPLMMQAYLDNVVNRFAEAGLGYQPFDLSDELELRYRYMLDWGKSTGRIELRHAGFFSTGQSSIPSAAGSANNRSLWGERLTYRTIEDEHSGRKQRYNARHVLTTYNVDRAIDPQGDPMVHLHSNDVVALYQAFWEGLSLLTVPGERERQAAQMAVNVVDFMDADSIPTKYTWAVTGEDSGAPILQGNAYGFEPHPYISEIAYHVDANNPREDSVFAVELYSPYMDASVRMSNLSLELRFADTNELFTTYPLATLEYRADANTPGSGRLVVSNRKIDSVADDIAEEYQNFALATYDDLGQVMDHFDIFLVTSLDGGETVYLDREFTRKEWFELSAGSDVPGQLTGKARDDEAWNVIVPGLVDEVSASLGLENDLPPTDTSAGVDPPQAFELLNPVWYRGANQADGQRFASVGEISLLPRFGPTENHEAFENTVGFQARRNRDQMHNVFFDVAQEAFQDVFQYLTVLPEHDPENPTDPDRRIKGRININTAPLYVLERLPWVQQVLSVDWLGVNIAQTIVERRRELKGFESIGDVMRAASSGGSNLYALASNKEDDQWPRNETSSSRSLDPAWDQLVDDIGERDLLFHRISNLITVRSDVFSAYILVRIGADGPQRRVLAILDRSEVLPDDNGGHTGAVKVVALQQVPDPR